VTLESAESPTSAPGGGVAGLGVLEKAMSVLNIVSAASLPLTFTDLLRAGNLPKATLHRILATLMREGLLRYVVSSKTYQLGFRLLELAHEVWSDFDLRLAAQDEMLRLRDALGQSVHLAVLDRDSMVVVASQDFGSVVRPDSLVGARWPVHATAVGKIMLAYLDSRQQADLLMALNLQALTPATCVTLEALRSELDLGRARGYAIDRGEHDADRYAVAAPILDIEGRPIGAIAVGMSADQANLSQLHAWSATVMGAARTIAHSAGGHFMSLQARVAPAQDAGPEVQCVHRVTSLLGEGPIWSPRDSVLYWVDILTPSVHWHDTRDATDHEIKLGSMVSVAIPKASGGLLVATSAGLMTLDTSTKNLTPLCHPEADRPGNRYNDGKCDRMGRLWIGSLDMATAANRGHLFRVDADGTWKKMDSGFSVANGLGWSPDNRQMYFTDSARRVIYVYDFDLLSGTVSNRRPLINLPGSDGTPDGLTVDEEGCLWVAVWDSWRVARYSPQGQEMSRIRMPVPRPTSCCFGGPNLDTLYVTSASLRLNQQALEAAPLSGSLFRLRIPGVRGLPETPFAG